MGTDKYSHVDAMIGGYASINEAIRDAPDGGVIYIAKGVYHERIVLDGPSITLQASPEVSILNLQYPCSSTYAMLRQEAARAMQM